jgi:hypothetical protein
MWKKLTNKEIDKRLEGRPILRIDDYDNMPPKTKKIRFQCLKNKEHIFCSLIDGVINRKWGCPLCLGVRKWTNELIDEEILKKGYQIKRISDVGKNGHEKIKFQCLKNKEHIFDNTPINALSGQCAGICRICSEREKFSNIMIREKLEQNNNTIELLDNIDYNKIKTFRCKKCDYSWSVKNFKMIIYGKTGCPKCAKHIKLTNEEIDVRLLNRNSPTKRLGDYISGHNEMLWKCEICQHEWHQKPGKILYYEQDCPICFRQQSSYIELYVGQCLYKNFEIFKPHFRIKNIEIFDDNHILIRQSVEIDFRIIYNNIIYFIEYNGRQHYEPVPYRFLTKEQAIRNLKEQQIRDSWVKNYCKTNNIKLIVIDGRTFNNKPSVRTIIDYISYQIKSPKYYYSGDYFLYC